MLILRPKEKRPRRTALKLCTGLTGHTATAVVVGHFGVEETPSHELFSHKTVVVPPSSRFTLQPYEPLIPFIQVPLDFLHFIYSLPTPGSQTTLGH